MNVPVLKVVLTPIVTLPAMVKFDNAVNARDEAVPRVAVKLPSTNRAAVGIVLKTLPVAADNTKFP
ncbi:MAG: hypothetical protein BWY67_01534 [Bacteroidetes bacterium ADurb.Bin397]|nr:MAG: hypothetical protein BWY67_01534 [Bacteroidetes bacterium ADurb.Bin397]